MVVDRPVSARAPLLKEAPSAFCGAVISSTGKTSEKQMAITNISRQMSQFSTARMKRFSDTVSLEERPNARVLFGTLENASVPLAWERDPRAGEGEEPEGLA